MHKPSILYVFNQYVRARRPAWRRPSAVQASLAELVVATDEMR